MRKSAAKATKKLTPHVFETIKENSIKLIELIDVDLLDQYLRKINSIDQLYNRRSRESKKIEGTFHENNKLLLKIRNDIFELDSEIDLIKNNLKKNMFEVGVFYETEFLKKENYKICSFRCPEQLLVLHALKDLFRKITLFDFGNNSSKALESLKEFKETVNKLKDEFTFSKAAI